MGTSFHESRTSGRSLFCAPDVLEFITLIMGSLSPGNIFRSGTLSPGKTIPGEYYLGKGTIPCQTPEYTKYKSSEKTFQERKKPKQTCNRAWFYNLSHYEPLTLLMTTAEERVGSSLGAFYIELLKVLILMTNYSQL